jgi:hypothetical protein
MNRESNPLELNVLRNFFDKVNIVDSISDSKIIRDTKGQLKVALLNAEHRCSCAKCSYGPCEVCQATSGALVPLRNFFRVIRNAKKHNMTDLEIKEFVANTQKSLMLEQ